ncbi:MAG: ParB/RepB/Spo0J family partition protein [Candidatus Hydrothermarchaeales archaeon]
MSKNNIIELSPARFDLRLKPLRLLPESSIQSMCRSLEAKGQITPLVAAIDQSAYVLVDGFKRQHAAQILGLTRVMVIIVPFEGAMMKAQMYLLNKNNGFSMIEECMLIQELVDKDGLNQVEAAAILDRHKSWVSRRLALMRSLTAQIVEDIKLGLIPTGSAQELARLPGCNQGDLGAVIQTHRLNVKQSNRLIDLWCKAKDKEVREFIIKSPGKALELSAQDEEERLDPRIPSRARGWVKAVMALERIAITVCLRSKKEIGPLEKEVYKILHESLNQADSACQEALRLARQRLLSMEE